MKSKKPASKSSATIQLLPNNRKLMVEDADTAILQAAECAVRIDADLNAFMHAAHGAFLHASPSTRERLETVHLMSHLDDLRRRGVLAKA
jgi:hypothetical protein